MGMQPGNLQLEEFTQSLVRSISRAGVMAKQAKVLLVTWHATFNCQIQYPATLLLTQLPTSTSTPVKAAQDDPDRRL